MSALEAWYVRDEAPAAVRERPADLVKERRGAKRLPIEVDVDVEGAAHRFRANTADLSTGGMFVVTHRDIPLGTHVMLSFKLPNGASLEVIGAIRWRRDKDAAAVAGLGISFFCLEPEARKVIHDFCGVREAIYAAPHPGSPQPASGEFQAITNIPRGEDD